MTVVPLYHAMQGNF